MVDLLNREQDVPENINQLLRLMLFSKLFYEEGQKPPKFMQKDLSSSSIWQIKNIWSLLLERLTRNIQWIETVEGYFDHNLEEEKNQIS